MRRFSGNSAELDFDSVQHPAASSWSAAAPRRSSAAAGSRASTTHRRDPRRRRGGPVQRVSELVNDAGRGASSTSGACRWKSQACRRPRSGATCKGATCCRSCRGTWSASTPSRRLRARPYQWSAWRPKERQLRVVDGEACQTRTRSSAQGENRSASGGRAHRRDPGQRRERARAAPARREQATARPGRPGSHRTAYRVLRHPTVANKVVPDPLATAPWAGCPPRPDGRPWRVPVADCAVTLADFESTLGEAMSMGEHRLAMLDAPLPAA